VRVGGDEAGASAPPIPQIPHSVRHDILAEILRQGDLEKFSPWGAAPADFAAIANRALVELAPEPVVEEAAA
jgi:hypothetical protein